MALMVYGCFHLNKSSLHKLGSNSIRIYVADREGMLHEQAEIIPKLKSPNSQNMTADNSSLTSILPIEGKIFSNTLKLTKLNRKNIFLDQENWYLCNFLASCCCTLKCGHDYV